MIDLKYTLKQDELRDYYETALMNDAEINKFHWKLRLFVPVGIVLSDKNIFVNGTEQKVYDYALFEHMIVIIFQNKTNILVPERVFNNEEERKTFIEGIHGICPLYQKSEVTNG